MQRHYNRFDLLTITLSILTVQSALLKFGDRLQNRRSPLAKSHTAPWWLTPLLGGVAAVTAGCHATSLSSLTNTILIDLPDSGPKQQQPSELTRPSVRTDMTQNLDPTDPPTNGPIAETPVPHPMRRSNTDPVAPLSNSPPSFSLSLFTAGAAPPPVSLDTATDQATGLVIAGDPRGQQLPDRDLLARRVGSVFSATLFQPALTDYRELVLQALAQAPQVQPQLASSLPTAPISPADGGPSSLDRGKIPAQTASTPTLDPVGTLVPGRPVGPLTGTAPSYLTNEPPAEAQPQKAEVTRTLQWSTDELPEWWAAKVADLQRDQATVRSVGLSDLINQAITQSPKIRMLQRLPALADTQIQRERGEFDPRLRLDTQYRSDRDPVGNQLQTGGPPVLQDNAWTANAGVQRRFTNGTTADLYQRLGFKNSNSLFFSPQDQGTATVGLDVTHPLWRNSGREFNQSLIVIAELQGQVSFFEYQAELQKEMVEIGNLYWQLLNARKIALQVARSRGRAQEILEILSARTDYDTSANQVSLAKAEVSQRQTEWLDAQQRLRDLEIALRDKINDPQFTSVEDIELIPAEFFADVFADESITLGEALEQALNTRWELQREERLTRVADRQLFISRCGLAPQLDLVLGVYSSGLAGESGIEQAWSNQFGAATPGFYGGFDYELPYGRRQAKADVQRDQLQKQQALDAYQIVRNEVVAQVRTAHSRVETAVQSRQAAFQTVLDMRDSLTHLQRRWEATALVDGGGVNGMAPSIALEQLLAAQRRLQDAEQRLANADLQWALARQALMLAMGEVLQSQLPADTNLDGVAPAAVQ